MTGPINGYLPDTDARLRVWTVQATMVDNHHSGPRAHVPAYTAGEAVQVAAAMSGLARKDWCRYWWTPTTHEETRP
jgi:hypothetical protein